VAVTVSRLSFWKHLKLFCVGRMRRFLLSNFRRGYVRASHERRRGECRRCGVCCQMHVRCPALRFNGDLAECARYQKWRTSNCRTFPIDERDIDERDLVAPRVPCGFHFVNGSETEKREGPA